MDDPHNSQTTRYSFPGHCNMYSSLYLICTSLTCKQIHAWNGEELYTLLASYKIAVQKTTMFNGRMSNLA